MAFKSKVTRLTITGNGDILINKDTLGYDPGEFYCRHSITIVSRDSDSGTKNSDAAFHVRVTPAGTEAERYLLVADRLSGGNVAEWACSILITPAESFLNVGSATTGTINGGSFPGIPFHGCAGRWSGFKVVFGNSEASDIHEVIIRSDLDLPSGL